MPRDIDITGPKTTQQDLACRDVPRCDTSCLYVNLHFRLARREFFFLCIVGKLVLRLYFLWFWWHPLVWLWMTSSVLHEFNPNFLHLMLHYRTQPQLRSLSKLLCAQHNTTCEMVNLTVFYEEFDASVVRVVEYRRCGGNKTP